MQNTEKKTACAARAARRVYLGFWTQPSMKSRLKKEAAARRQSVSALVDSIIEAHFIRARMGLA